MSRSEKSSIASRVNIALFIVAAILLLISVVGGTRAALTYYSDTYVARFAVSDIGVTLTENGEAVAYRDYDGNDSWRESTGTWEGADQISASGDLLTNMLGSGEQLVLGKTYPERIAVTNSGTIDQYVRVKLLKYWEDADGNKVNTVSPDLIKIDMADGYASSWITDRLSSTAERSIYYYNRVLRAGQNTPDLTKSITIDPAIATKVTQERVGDTIITKYDYNGLRFCLEAEVDAVQDHNVVGAALSTWGAGVNASDGTLSLG